MATIVQMPSPRSKITRSADDHDGATILFFTGVRYVRDEEPSDEAAVLAPATHFTAADVLEPALSLI